MKKFKSMFIKCENPKDKEDIEKCARIEKEKRDYFKKQDQARYKKLLKTKGYTDSKLSEMSHGDLSNAYDVHSKLIPSTIKQIKKDQEKEYNMNVIKYYTSEESRQEGNARKYLTSLKEYIPSHLSGKEVREIADLKYRLRRLRDLPETKDDSEYKVGKLPNPPRHNPVTKKGGKKKKRKTNKTSKKKRKSVKKKYGKDKIKSRRH